MARRQSAKTPPPASFDAVEANRIFDELVRQGKLASEYAGQKGATAKNGSQRIGVDVRSLSVVHQLDKLTPAKRDARLADIIRLAHVRGMFDQTSLDENGVRNVLLNTADEVAGAGGDPPKGHEDKSREDLDAIIH